MSTVSGIARRWLGLRARTASRARKAVARIPASLVWIAAVGAILFLSEGTFPGSRVAMGFAERVNLAVSPIRPGRVKSMSVKLGQSVKQGEVIATLETEEIEARLAQAKSTLLEMNAKVEAQRNILESQVARGEIWLLKARANEQEGRARLHELEIQLKRLEALEAQQLVPASAVEAIRKDHAVMAARVATYTGVKGQGAESAPSILPEARHDIAESVALRMAPFQAAAQSQEAAVKVLEIELGQMTLRAPADGIVATMSKRQGEYAAAGSEVASLVSTRRAHITAFLPMRVANELAIGTTVKAKRTNAIGISKPGTVVEMSPAIDEVPVRLRISPQIPQYGRRVIIELANPSDLIPGELFEVAL